MEGAVDTVGGAVRADDSKPGRMHSCAAVGVVVAAPSPAQAAASEPIDSPARGIVQLP